MKDTEGNQGEEAGEECVYHTHMLHHIHYTKKSRWPKGAEKVGKRYRYSAFLTIKARGPYHGQSFDQVMLGSGANEVALRCER
jgi:hypothetical protein